MRRALVPLLALAPLAAEDARHPDPGAAAETRAQGDRDAWSMSPLVIHGADAADTDPVGPTGQPLWTARRRFAETRTYVVPDGAVEVEGWYQLEQMRHDEPRATELIYELEIGLPWRSQLDVFEVKRKEGADGSLGGRDRRRLADRALDRHRRGRLLGPRAHAPRPRPSAAPR